MKLKCIVCGDDAEIESFCEKCWLERKRLFNISGFEVKMCDCGACFVGGEWIRFRGAEDAVKKMILRKIKTENRIKDCGISLKQTGNMIKAKVECRGTIEPCKLIKTEEKTIEIKIKKSKCEECKKECASYYEAIIQLRCDKDIMDNIIRSCDESVLAIREVRGGFDVYIKDNNTAKRVADILKRRGLNVLRSFKYITQKNNKKIYRNYYSVKGD